MIRPARSVNDREKEQLSKRAKTWIKWLTVGGIIAAFVIFVPVGILAGWYRAPATIAPDVPEYGIAVFDAWSGEDLTTANISYWDSDDGLPEDMLAFGTMDNVTMLNFDFPSGDIWAKVELANYQTTWVVLDKTDSNSIGLLKIPQDNAVGMILDGDGIVLGNVNDTEMGTLRFTFPLAQNGTGFRPSFLADLNETIYIEMIFEFNITPSSAFIEIANEITDDIDVVGDTIVIPISASLIIGDSPLSNYIELTITVDHGEAAQLDFVYMVYDGVTFGTIALT